MPDLTVTLVRDAFVTEGPTMGVLTTDTKVYQTLELPWLKNQANISCIPVGTYPLAYRFSNRFQRMMPWILNVPGRSTIEIHSLRVMAQTDGCVGIGYKRLSTVPPSLDPAQAILASGDFRTWLQSRLGLQGNAMNIFLAVSYADGSNPTWL